MDIINLPNRQRKTRYCCLVVVVLVMFGLMSCSSSKFIPDGGYLLKRVEICCDDKDIATSSLEPYIRQKANSKWFSLFKIPLGIYDMSGRDSTKWINRTLRHMGEAPVIYDSVLAARSSSNLSEALQNMGYLNATTRYRLETKDRKATVTYDISAGVPYSMGVIKYVIADSLVSVVLRENHWEKDCLKSGMRFSIDNLEGERKRITQILTNNGYFRFNKDFIKFDADSCQGNHTVNLVVRLAKYKPSNNSAERNHPRYLVRNIQYLGEDSARIHLRRRVLENNTAIKEGKPFSADALQNTYNNFAKLQAVRFTNIHFEELPDTALLDCKIQISTNKPSTLSFQPEGTNTAGDLGAAASLTYENRNLFRGSELLSIQVRAAFEAIKGLEGYLNQNYVEYNVETKLTFPRIIAPFLSKSFRRRSNARSELLFSYNLQNRPEFHRRVTTGAWRYRWSEPHHHSHYRLDLIDMNYVHMPWISESFKNDYLDNATTRNAILRYNYEDLFIMKTGASVTYNNGKRALKANIELGGNVLSLIAHAAKLGKNSDGQYTLFNIAFAQYVKADFDYSRLVSFDPKNALAFHFNFGVAYPYGNSRILPFEKRYFSGGANSVRGWSVRELGPGKFRGTDGRIDFINQTGDMKLDLNLEYRTFLFWKFNGAVFIDAGNIWTLRKYDDQPGGQFKVNEFYKQLAASYGLGLRLNLDYFVLRLDCGMKAVNPAYETSKEHFPIIHPSFGRDLSVHFAVGLPF